MILYESRLPAGIERGWPMRKSLFDIVNRNAARGTHFLPTQWGRIKSLPPDLIRGRGSYRQLAPAVSLDIPGSIARFRVPLSHEVGEG
jgi:hypothetical protein